MKAAFLFIRFCTAGFTVSAIIMSKGQLVSKIENHASLDSLKIAGQNVRVIFWNVENLYDPYDDTTKLDDEFTSHALDLFKIQDKTEPRSQNTDFCGWLGGSANSGFV